MKALILGGCGVMGSSVARDLIKSDDITEVILADRRIDMAKMHKSLQNSKKVSTQTIDVAEFKALVRLIKGNDVVINCVGPFYKYAISIMKATIEAGVNYLDIMDDYDTTIAAFKEMDQPARKAGLSLCIGFGSSPGFGNIIVKYAADKLDEVDEVRILWLGAINDPSGTGAMAHAFHCLKGEHPQYLDGKLVNVAGFDGEEEFDFGEPYGKCPVYYFGHPEPITIPRYIKGVKTVVNKGGFLPLWFNQLIKELIARGFAEDEPILVGSASVVPIDFVTSIIGQSPILRKQVEAYTTAPFSAVIKGKEGNKNVTYVYSSGGGAMAPGTAIPASICAQMLARGDIKVKGVVAPEGCIDPNAFFREFARRGFRLSETKTVTEEIKF
ncbi:MAG: saccharopine dehydrogenase NADP-binding domain-containing protein [Dehalococcoidia bacterium]